MLDLRIPPPLVALAAALAIWGIYRVFPPFSVSFMPDPIVALPIAVLGVTIDVLALYRFWRLRTTVNPLAPEGTSALVTDGVYRLSRNPMYLGLFFLLLAWCIHLGDARGFAVLLMFVLYLNRFQIVPEENVMAEKFGDRYSEYRATTRRWI
ncbi:MAG: isoprenylcysteine carboxylmethyltransferase family protein [Pseudomonadota bacterium]